MVEFTALIPLGYADMGAVNTLRENVRALLHARRLKQSDLRRAIGISAASLSGFLKGKQALDINRLDALAQALGTDVPSLFVDRDLAWQGETLEIASKGRSPHAQLTALIDRYQSISQQLFDLATQGIERETAPPAAIRSADPHRPRKTRQSRARKPPLTQKEPQ